jgi:hypothetical protein
MEIVPRMEESISRSTDCADVPEFVNLKTIKIDSELKQIKSVVIWTCDSDTGCPLTAADETVWPIRIRVTNPLFPVAELDAAPFLRELSKFALAEPGAYVKNIRALNAVTMDCPSETHPNEFTA